MNDHAALPERDSAKTNTLQGLYRKFEVRRTDGSDFPGGKHDGCDYFVLDMTHDPHAKAAAAAYADSAETNHPDLAADMRARYGLDTLTLTRPADGDGKEPGNWFAEVLASAGEVIPLSAAPQQSAKVGRVCNWRQQDEGHDTFSTGCGHEYTVNDCTDGNVQLPYCPFCAKPLRGIAWNESDDISLSEALTAAAPHQHGQEVDAALVAWLEKRGLMPDAPDGTVDMADIVRALDDHERELMQPQHQADAVAEYQYRKPGAHDDSWRRMTREEYEASLATGHCCGIASWTKNFELRKLYATPTTDQQPEAAAVELDGADSEVLREFIRLCREVKPVGQWPGERVCAAIERFVLNENQQPAEAVAVASIVSARRPYGVPAINWLMTTDAKAIRPGTPLYLAPPTAIDIGKLRELVARWRKDANYQVIRVMAKQQIANADELAAIIGDGGERANG